MQRQIRRHHADQRDVRKIQSLSDHLRADQHLRLPASELGKNPLMRILAAGRIHVHARYLHAGEPREHLFLHLLRARSEELDKLAPAFRADFRGLALLAAVMAVQHVVVHMIGHGHVAVFALFHMTARTAGNEGRIAAPVDKENDLMPLIEALLHLPDQRAAEDGLVALHQFFAHVHDFHLGQPASAHPLVHFDQRQLIPRLDAGHGLHIGGDGRRRAAQQHNRPMIFRPPFRNIARVIPRTFVGQIARFMLLVHDDDAGLLQRRKNRRSRADDHLRLARTDSAPLVEALSGRQPRMKHRRVAAEALSEPVDHLRRQRNFRHQHDGRAPAFDRLPDGADIDLGLSTAGHAVQEKPSALAVQRPLDLIQRLFLTLHQLRVGQRLAVQRLVGRSPYFIIFDSDDSLLGQLVHRAGRDGIEQRHGLCPVLQRLDDLQPLPGAAVFPNRILQRLAFNAQTGHRHLLFLDPTAAHLRGNHLPQAVHQIAVIPLFHPLGQLDQLGQDYRIILQRARNRLDQPRVELALIL